MSSFWVTFLFEATNFLLLAALLGWLFFRPAREALARRRASLEGELGAAREARERAEKELEALRSQRVELERTAEALLDRARRDAEREAARILAEARARAEREREASMGELRALRRAALAEARRDGARAAAILVRRLLTRIGGPDLDEALTRAACEEVRTLRQRGPLAPVLVEAAREPGSGGVQRIAEAAGVDSSELEVRTDPELGAGLRVITRRGAVDLSAIGIAREVETELLRELGGAEEGGQRPAETRHD